MTAQTLPAPLLPAPAAPSTTHGGSGLGLQVCAVFAVLCVLVLALTLLAFLRLQGGVAQVALALGCLALAGLAGTAVWVVRSMVRPLEPITAAVDRLSAGDLTVEVDVGGAGALRPLGRALHQVRAHLAGLVGQVRLGTTNLAMNAAVINRDNAALSRRTEIQADSLQETAASMEELTAAVRQNAGTAQQAHALARQASERAQQGGEVMREVVQTMDSIRASSASIRDIIGVIDGIAFQTNILALNAAVEAARAGEQGRGFAVVAGEVRVLAQRCAEAAREIKGLIGASVDKVDTGGTRVDEASRSMEAIVAAVRHVADLLGQMATASQEQSSGIDTISLAISRIDSTTQENASFVKASVRTAAALQERAVTLQQAVAAFRMGDREHGTAEDAVALVRRGVEYLRARGREALLAEINRLDLGALVDRDLYLIVIEIDTSIFIAHGNNPGRIGTGPKVADVEGKLFGVEMARVGRDRGEGWVDYKWVHPVTQQVSTKGSYVLRQGDVVLVCPYTKT